MYTQGVMQILTLEHIYYASTDKLFEIADDIGYKAVLHNGCIYCSDDKGCWYQTPFTLDDFKVNN